MYVKQKVLKMVQFVGNVTSKEINLHARPNYPSWKTNNESNKQPYMPEPQRQCYLDSKPENQKHHPRLPQP